jgi:hypothetical protein
MVVVGLHEKLLPLVAPALKRCPVPPTPEVEWVSRKLDGLLKDSRLTGDAEQR